MEIIFLGTSSGVPTQTRNVSGVAIRRQQSKSWFLVDCGEGTQHQLLKAANLSLNHLAAICITHIHGDHCYGLPGLLASAAMAGRTATLTLIAPYSIKKYFESIQVFTQLRLSYDVHFILTDDVNDISQDNNTINMGDFVIEVTELSHRVPSYAFTFTENKLPKKLNIKKLTADGIAPSQIWGLLQKGNDVHLSDGKVLYSRDYTLEQRLPRKVIIAGDNDNPWKLNSCADKANLLIHESTYTETIAKKIGNAPKHSTAKQVAQFGAELSIPHLILTHFSPRYKDSTDSSPNILDIEQEARKHYKGRLFLARDYDVYQLDNTGELKKTSIF